MAITDGRVAGELDGTGTTYADGKGGFPWAVGFAVLGLMGGNHPFNMAIDDVLLVHCEIISSGGSMRFRYRYTQHAPP
jgi:hypothetical protein